MPYHISAIDSNKSTVLVNIDKYPDHCPICHIGIEAKQLAYYVSGTSGVYLSFEMLCRCPRHECGRVFLALYKPQLVGGTVFFYREAVPSIYQAPSIPESVQKISPSFYAIYSQAYQAESSGLKEICGPGYRKSLEFLVKDFILNPASKVNAERDAINKIPLASCIESYIEDPTTKAMARLATWLGNDETHYYRKWADKDLNDLKKLIHLTVNAIDSKLTMDGYLEDMSKDKEVGNKPKSARS
ncbi:MAG: DUF4145 domain-containing protein [Candidatus Omnitrophica bacterium]|nr:DUF4145 domain-containing protein [Candidatus Omnitrophota bacterium]